MPLVSKLFTDPIDADLEACLIDDKAHITPGSRGEHVRKIQIALNRLSEGTGRNEVFLAMDGNYGPRTAEAVKRYKNARNILQPWQKTADDIVGKRTIQSLDTEMDFLENEVDQASQYVCLTWEGEKHDHSKCPPLVDAEQEAAPDHKTISHNLTPRNPVGTGRMLSIGGRGEVRYLGFIDAVPDPACDKSFPANWVLGRTLTSSIANGTVSDVCFRSVPLDEWMVVELQRICIKGARLTFVGTLLDTTNPDALSTHMQRAKSLGRVIEQGSTLDPEYGEREWLVITVDKVNHALQPCNRASPTMVHALRRR